MIEKGKGLDLDQPSLKLTCDYFMGTIFVFEICAFAFIFLSSMNHWITKM